MLIGMRELLVEQEDGEGEVSLLLLDREGMLVLSGRPEAFSRPRLTSRWIGETELKIGRGETLGLLLPQLTRHRYQPCRNNCKQLLISY